MERNRADGKRSVNDVIMNNNEDEQEEEEDNNEDNVAEDYNKKKRALTVSGKKMVSGVAGNSSPSSTLPSCQVDSCSTDMSSSKPYHRRHKVCELHAKAPIVLVAGLQKRFCQQCSRFHELSEFDESKRSCRRRLAGHNERRRKSSYDSLSQGEGPS